MWTSWSDLKGRAPCGRSWRHGWRPAQEWTGEKPSGAGGREPTTGGSRSRATDDGRLAIGNDGSPPIRLIGVGVRVWTAPSRAGSSLR